MQLIRQNLFSYYREIGRSSMVDYEITDCFEWIKGESGWPRMIFNLSNKHDQNKLLEKIKQRMLRDEIPPFLIIDDLANTPIEHSCLEKYGFRAVMVWKGMHTNTGQQRNKKSGNDLIVKKIESEKGILDFTYILNKTLLSSNPVSEKVFLELKDNAAFSFFNGYIEDKVVSTSLGFTENQVCGLYMIATLPEFRGRGYGSLMTNTVISDQYDQGIRDFVLQATRAGEKIYQKYRFKAYGLFYIYWLLGK